MRTGQLIFVSICLMAMVAGCGGRSRGEARPLATNIPAEQAEPSYWLAQPAVATVRAADYERLFAACEHVLRQRRFEIDRQDYRSGLLTTRPLISQQIWEPWRSDVGSTGQMMASSLATYRRVVRWDIASEGGDFVATPRVVVERFSDQSRRVTSAVQYRGALSGAEAESRLSSPQLSQVPADRWYATGRDEALERDLASDVAGQLKQK